MGGAWSGSKTGAHVKHNFSRDANAVQKTPRRNSPPFRQGVQTQVFFLNPRLQTRYFDSTFISKLTKSQTLNRLSNNQSKAVGWLLPPHDRKSSETTCMPTESQDGLVRTPGRHRGPPAPVPAVSPFFAVSPRGRSLHPSWVTFLTHPTTPSPA